MTEHTFLALTNADLGLSSLTILGAVYAPGLVCTNCQHPLNFGMVVNTQTGLALLGQTCAVNHQPKLWVKALQSKKYYLSKFEVDQDAKLPVSQQVYFRAATLYRQMHPEEFFARLMLLPFFKDEEVTPELCHDISRMVRPIGKLKDLLSRRDQLFRLQLLIELGDQLENQKAKIAGLLKVTLLNGLTKKQNAMVVAIQHEYGENLMPFSQKLLAAWPPAYGSITLK